MKRVVKKKWTDKAHFHISVDMFKVDIVFVCNCDKKEVLLKLKMALRENFKYFESARIGDWDEETIIGRMMCFRGGFIVLLKDNKGNFSNYISNLIHEITHVVSYLLRDRSIPLTEDTEEVYAYLTEYITREALLKLYD